MLVSELTLNYKKFVLNENIFDNSRIIYELLDGIFDKNLIEYREEFIVLFFDNSLKCIGYNQLGVGDHSSCLVDIKRLLTCTLLSGASRVVISHNHPSGLLKPSENDLKLTKRIKEVLEILGVQLIDHIIVSSDKYLSFYEENIL